MEQNSATARVLLGPDDWETVTDRVGSMNHSLHFTKFRLSKHLAKHKWISFTASKPYHAVLSISLADGMHCVTI